MFEDSDNLTLLAADLRALSPRQRRDVLASLNSFERMSVRALLEETGPDASMFAHFSGPIAACLRRAEVGEEEPGSTPMTQTTRRLAVQLAIEAESVDFEAARTAVTRRSESLFSAVGHWLTRRRTAP